MDYNSPPTSSFIFKNLISNQATRTGIKRILGIGEVLLCSVSITVVVVILMAIPIAMIAIGIYHINNCSIQKMIPIWLIVIGALAITKNVSTLFSRFKNKQENSGSKLLSLFDSFLTLFIIIWFICGNIWVYSNFSKAQTSNPEQSDDYCHPLVLHLAFWIINAVYIIIVTSCIVFCCTVCVAIFIPSKK
ncbi:unnamed protein product [Brachionus calyciflorus]|uniref:Uncharacterized protein n=1 Tax=Brachionus calyciflorus TaxID=104777 RepID=A0A813UND0_9BILA|nr:unnamed protein product [Brachionus calyciflorus]